MQKGSIAHTRTPGGIRLVSTGPNAKRTTYHRTPVQLRADGIPEHPGGRRLDRAPLAFCDVDPNTGEKRKVKKPYLALKWVMQMAKATEETGGDPNRVKRVCQEYMANMLGVDISTFNRYMQLFTDPDGRWDSECGCRRCKGSGMTRRQCHGVRKKEQAQAQGKKLRENSKCRTIPRLRKMFNKQGGVGMALRYSDHMPGELKPTLEKRNSDTADAEALAKAFGTDWFDPTATVNGYKFIEGWILHPNLRATERCVCRLGQMVFNFQSDCARCGGKGHRILDTPMPAGPRVFLIVLKMLGIADKGFVEMTQEDLGNLMGAHRNTIARYEDIWEDRKILEVVPGATWKQCVVHGERFRAKKKESGSIESISTPIASEKCRVCGTTEGPVVDRDPHRLIWLPGRILDAEAAQKERERFLEAAAHVRNEHDAQRANQIHLGLIRAWTGSLHSMGSLWSECRQQMAAQNLHRDVIDALIPPYRE